VIEAPYLTPGEQTTIGAEPASRGTWASTAIAANEGAPAFSPFGVSPPWMGGVYPSIYQSIRRAILMQKYKEFSVQPLFQYPGK
jgi:hypothetical protein